MERFLVALLVTVTVSGPGRTASADDADVTVILDKAMKALGGEDSLGKIKGATWKARGKITLGDHKEQEFTGQTTTQGLDRFRSELEVAYLDGTKLKFLSVLNGDKAWHMVGDMALYPDAAVARQKRTVYLAVIPVTLAPVKGPGFKVQAAGEEKVGGRPAVVLKVTCPDGKDITISFDKESGLPVKAVGKVFTLDGREVTQETTYGDYKDFGGIKIGHPDRVQDRRQARSEAGGHRVQGPGQGRPPGHRHFGGGGRLRAGAHAVPGPESEKLLPATTGYVLFAFGSDRPDGVPDGEIVAVQLPSLKNTIVRPRTPQNQVDMPTIHAVSGPDAEGRVAYIEDHFFVADQKNRRHLLKTIRLDGTRDTELFTRPGDAMWATKGEIGDDLALSPVGGRVAFLSGLAHARMPSATCLLMNGTVEIWDVEQKTASKASFQALDAGHAWFPDGKRLAYVKLVERAAVAPAVPPTDSFGKSFKGWEKVPAVFIRDVDARTESFLHLGWHPVVSSDGQSVLVSDLENAWRRMDVATGKSIAATWPGVWTPIAMPTRDVVLSLCLPTKGVKVRFTEHNSPLVGPKEMLSVKLARVNAAEFQSVVSHVNPRTRVSFGQVGQSKRK